MGTYAYGQPATRREDQRLLTGQGRYLDDLAEPGMLRAVLLRSPHAHARIAAIDVAKARKAKGVKLVATAADLAADKVPPLLWQGPFKRADGSDHARTPRPVLAEGVVRHVGEAVALVVADTLAHALDAAERIEVDYDPLPAIASTRAATQAGRPAVWPEAPDNVAYVWERGEKAAVDAAFARAAHVTRLDFDVSRIVVASLEPRGAIATYDPEAKSYVLQSSTQSPHVMRDAIAKPVLDLAPDALRVVARDVGGGFGMKIGVYPEDVLVLWAARKLGRPVKWVSDRTEAFLSDTQARDNALGAELALDADGNFLALRVRQDIAVGAYLSWRSASAVNNAGGVAGIYGLPAIHMAIRGVLTHTVPTGPYRGAGRPEATYVIERLIDLAARETGRDPLALRRQNLVPPSAMPFKTALTFTYDCGDFPTLLERAVKAGDMAGFAKRRAASEKRGRLRGIGFAAAIEVAGGPFGGTPKDEARISVGPDGKVVVHVGAFSTGTGLETMTALIVAAGLGIATEAVEVRMGDTADLATGRGSGGSGGLCVSGAAVQSNVDKVVERGKQIAGHLLEASVADVELKAGKFRVVGTDRSVTWRDVARAAHRPGALPPGMAPGLTEAVQFQGQGPTFPNGCHVSEVEIDPETGVVTLDRHTVVEDLGRVLNPLTVEGQVHGGIAQAVGQALGEATEYDAGTGQLLTASFMDYQMPRAGDLPMFKLEMAPVLTKMNVLGAKGVGEAGTVGALSAVMNAICDALAPLGIKHLDMPATPLRVWQAIQKAKS